MMIKKFLFCLTLVVFPFSSYGEELSTTVQAAAAERYVETEGAALFCRSIGKGKPLVIIHGGPGLSQDYLLPQMDRLAENNFLIFYDQRGCGRSTGEINKETITIETYLNDLEAIRKAYNFEKISILGHSWGGFLAMEYAIAHEDKVDRLILSNSMPASSEEVALFIKEYMKRTAPIREKLNAIQKSDSFVAGDPETVAEYYRLVFATYCYKASDADQINLQMSSSAAVRGAKVSALLRQIAFEKPFSLHEQLESITIPTLVISGDVDPIPYSTAENLHKSIKGSVFLLLKPCGHFPFVEEPTAYFNAINSFFNSL